MGFRSSPQKESYAMLQVPEDASEAFITESFLRLTLESSTVDYDFNGTRGWHKQLAGAYIIAIEDAKARAERDDDHHPASTRSQASEDAESRDLGRMQTDLEVLQGQEQILSEQLAKVQNDTDEMNRTRVQQHLLEDLLLAEARKQSQQTLIMYQGRLIYHLQKELDSLEPKMEEVTMRIAAARFREERRLAKAEAKKKRQKREESI